MVDDIGILSSLKGRVALVTGGGGGIGRAITGQLLAAGVQVVICGRSEPASLPEHDGVLAHFMACDVRKADQVASLFDRIVALFGRLDIVVNNAGGSPLADVVDASPRFLESIIALNLTGPLFVAQAAAKIMLSQAEGGSIINVASLSGTRPSPGTAAYGAAKAGLLNLTQTLAMEWGPTLRVNAIVVGLMSMEGGDEHYGTADVRERIAASIPMGRLGAPKDVADAVLYLASPLAAYVSGATLAVHGGGERPAFLVIGEN